MMVNHTYDHAMFVRRGQREREKKRCTQEQWQQENKASSSMPYKPRTPCAHPGCPSTSNERYCEKHKKSGPRLNDNYRLQAHKRGYDSNWSKFRKAYISEHPLCVVCQKAGCIVPTEIVDHVVPLDQGGDKWAEANLQPLCRSHHAEKTAKDQRG